MGTQEDEAAKVAASCSLSLPAAAFVPSAQKTAKWQQNSCPSQFLA
jgi:hypothetical protein